MQLNSSEIGVASSSRREDSEFSEFSIGGSGDSGISRTSERGSENRTFLELLSLERGEIFWGWLREGDI